MTQICSDFFFPRSCCLLEEAILETQNLKQLRKESTISHSMLFHIAGDFSKSHWVSFPPKFLGRGCELGESALPNHKQQPAASPSPVGFRSVFRPAYAQEMKALRLSPEFHLPETRVYWPCASFCIQLLKATLTLPKPLPWVSFLTTYTHSQVILSSDEFTFFSGVD